MGIKIVESPRKSFGVAAITLEGSSVKAVGAAANAMKKVIVAGAPGRLSGVGTKGAKLSVRYDVKGTTNPVALLRAVGPWQLIEGDTKAHDIKAKVRRSRRNPRAAVKTPGGPRRVAHHPGTKGQRPWAKGVERGTPAATLAYARTIRADLRKQFG